MAYQFRVLSAAPSQTDSIAVYAAGLARAPENLIAGLKDLAGNAIPNPFTAAEAGGVFHWGFNPTTRIAVDVWWVEGAEYLSKNEVVDPTADIGAEPRLTGAAVDAAPQDADTVYGGNAGSAFATIKTTWTVIKAFLKTYFDTLYAGISHKASHATGSGDALAPSDIGAQPFDQQLADLAASPITIVPTTGQVSKAGTLIVGMATDATINAAHAGATIRWTKGTPGNITIPKDATYNAPFGTTIMLYNSGAGKATLVAEDGTIIIRAKNGLVSTGQYAVFGIYKDAANLWVAFGDLATS